MTRRDSRIAVFRMIFQAEFNSEDEMNEKLQKLLNPEENADEKDLISPEATAEELDYIQKKSAAILEHLEEIDARINENSKTWSTSRMPKVDLSLMRVAVYEILYEEDVPAKVAVNEAVEIAKIYSTDNSPAYINGVLGNLVKNEQ